MVTCGKCAELGSAFWEPEFESSAHPGGSQSRTRVASLPVKRKVSIKVPEDVAVIDSFGLLVRQARQKLGLSQEDLGRKIGEKASVIGKIESEKMVPDQRLSAKLEHILRVRLLMPISESKNFFPSSAPSKGVTLGEIAILKNGKKRRSPEDERNHS